MALYNKKGNAEYFDTGEISGFVRRYLFFEARVESALTPKSRDRSLHAKCLLEGEIQEMRDYPVELRNLSAFNTMKQDYRPTDSALKKLEEKCRRIIQRNPTHKDP